MRQTGQMSAQERQMYNLVRQVKDRVAGLLTERDGKPHLPTAEALVAVAAALVASACRTKNKDPVDLINMRLKFEALSGALRKTLDDRLEGHGARFPASQTTSTTARTPATVSWSK